MADIRVGSIAIAKRASGEWSVDEPGVCYEVYELEGRAGYSFIFEKGGYDGFSPEDVETYLHVTGEQSAALAGYPTLAANSRHRRSGAANASETEPTNPPGRLVTAPL